LTEHDRPNGTLNHLFDPIFTPAIAQKSLQISQKKHWVLCFEAGQSHKHFFQAVNSGVSLTGCFSSEAKPDTSFVTSG
jgi:hypothetical protein